MLSKTQFNAAVKRLQAQLTPQHLFKMLEKSIDKDTCNENDVAKSLESLKSSLSGNTPLDRRRAENYLANALYGQNHSQIAHKLIDDKNITNEDLAKRYEVYGLLLNYFNPDCWGATDGVYIDDTKEHFFTKLKDTSINDFEVNYFNFDRCQEDTTNSIKVMHGVFMVNFKDTAITAEVIYYRDNNSISWRNRPDAIYGTVSVNNTSLADYLSARYDDLEEDYLCETVGDFVSDIGFFIGTHIDYESTMDVTASHTPSLRLPNESEWTYNAKYPYKLKDFLDKGYPNFVIQQSSLKNYLAKVDASCKQILSDREDPDTAFDYQDYEIKVKNWLRPYNQDDYQKRAIITLSSKRGEIVIDYWFTPYSDASPTGKFLRISINGEVVAKTDKLIGGSSKDPLIKIADTLNELEFFFEQLDPDYN
tara:strand:+ start:7274 stop:8536 length:1263 start_codon:yes stop_codon:yes gene_type:complete